MDLRNYFNKIKVIEKELDGKDTVVCSCKTSDGGREGVLTEVPARVAGQLIADQRARLATPEEVSAFRSEQQQALRAAEEAKAAQRIQVRLVQADSDRKR